MAKKINLLPLAGLALLALVVLLVLFAAAVGPAEAAISFVQSTGKFNTASGTSITSPAFATNPVVGNKIIVLACGGDGGGIIFIIAISLSNSGTISANGANGTATVDRRGASGGGAGGSILIRANSITGTTNPAASTAGTPVGTSATWAAAEDTLLNLAKSTPKRLRFEVSNEGTGAASGTTYRLEVSGPDPASCSAAAFSAVPTAATGHWQIVDSANLTGGAASTNVTPGLTDANPTFVPGRVMDTGNQTTGISLSTTEFTEIEFALQATANATDGAL
jgi:hypothetical protein